MGTCLLSAWPLLFIPFFLCLPLFAQHEERPTHTFHDSANHLSFNFPANWNFAEQDHEISTFHLDARTAPRNATLRAVVAMPQNPFPESTFSGAYLYFSVTPHSSAAACARQTVAPKLTPGEAARRAVENAPETAAAPEPNPASALAPGPTLSLTSDKIQIAGIPFTHGRDQQRDICITQRDEVYTTLHRGACYRFDLVINNFCGGQVSGVKDITEKELDQVRARLESILNTVRFDPK
jgi:hypothetical protein